MGVLITELPSADMTPAGSYSRTGQAVSAIFHEEKMRILTFKTRGLDSSSGSSGGSRDQTEGGTQPGQDWGFGG